MTNERFTSIGTLAAAKSLSEPTLCKRRNNFVFIALAAAVLVSLTQVGCTGLTSANPPPPTTTATASVTGATGSFGNVGTGGATVQTFTVTNTGTATLTITQLAASGTGFSVSGMTLPMTMNAGQSAPFTAKFSPTALGAATGSISMTANTNPAVSTIALSGTGVSAGQPTISVTPTSVSFGGVGIGQNVGQLMTISNIGSSVLTVSNVTVSGTGFSLTGVSLPISLLANETASFITHVDLAAAGNVAGSVTITNNSSIPTVVVPLSAVGMAGTGQPGISVGPGSFDFANVAVGVTSAHTFTITNSGTAALSVSNIAAAGTGFSVSGFSLPMSVPAGQSAAFTGNFVPAAAGPVGGSITITNNSATPSVVVGLNGTGAAPGQPLIATNPTSVSFGNVIIGAPNSQPILIQNNGTAALNISAATVSGAGFSISGLAVPATIAGGGSTTLNVAFAPASAGAVTGSISLVSNAVGSPLAIPLSGTGVAATQLLGASSLSVAFGSVALGSNSSQNVTLTNSGNSTVTIGTVSVAGAGFSSSGVSAGQTIGAGQTATLSVGFAPASAATVSGTVSVTSNATNSPINISLSGTGMQVVAHSVSLSWTASTSTVVGYNVYRSTTSGGPYTLITAVPVAGTTFTDNAVQAGQTYFYVVTAVDANGNESVNSNEASAIVPTP